MTDSTTGSRAFPSKIHYAGTVFNFLKLRYRGGATYVAVDRSAYLRVGEPSAVLWEFQTCRDLERRGYPVPSVMAYGSVDTARALFMERPAGSQTFGEQFLRQSAASAARTSRLPAHTPQSVRHRRTAVHGDTFQSFLGVMRDYATAQFHPTNRRPGKPGDMAQLVLLDDVLRHHPPADVDEFTEVYAQVEKRMLELPWCLSQPDLNPFNVLPGGVIDFELAAPAPVGFDVATCVLFGWFWPERMIAYRLSEAQVQDYLDTLDSSAAEFGLPPVSASMNEFLLLKAIWATAKDAFHQQHPQTDPDLWIWRTAVRDWCVQEYLAGRPLDVWRFAEVGGAALNATAG